MLTNVGHYFSDLAHSFGSGWNRFWFAPRGVWHLALLRQLVGLLGLVWLASFSFDLTASFGEHGVLTLDAVHQVMTSGDPTENVPGFSHLFFWRSNSEVWLSHLACLLVLLLMTLGLFPRLTVPLSLLVVLSYIHRGPILTRLFEPILCMFLLYLSVVPGPALTGLLRQKEPGRETWAANVATRLIQVHLCGFYLLIGCSQLGSPVWWTGDAVMFFVSDAQHRLLDLTAILRHTYLLNAVTHAWVLFNLAFPMLIWVRKARPLLIGLSIIVWAWTALVTGQVGFAAIMAVSNLAFVSSETVAGWFQRWQPEVVGQETSAPQPSTD